MSKRTAMMTMTAQQKQQIQQQTGKNPDDMSEDELNDAMDKTGVTPGGSDTQIQQLEQLGKLKESGVLTEQEFETKKAQILKPP
jgi:hypothetical protein